MSDPYVKFDSLKFANRKHKSFCKLLHKEIREMEDNLMADEESYEIIKNLSPTAGEMALKSMELNRKVLFAMKLVFWYNTGRNASHVLEDDKVVDIFNVA